jgi:hypothetical protein
VIWSGLAVAAAAPLIWQFVLEGYQRQRILTLFDPQSDPLGAGWNIIQSTTAIGSGGLFGKGLFQGSQSYLEFLPEARTDFIVAVLAEELGFVGVAFLLLMYLTDHSAWFLVGVSGRKYVWSPPSRCIRTSRFLSTCSLMWPWSAVFCRLLVCPYPWSVMVAPRQLR